jgi:UDP-N-acetylmuramoyl-tripeptide--D-alanyl-D-alanine ligase
MATPQGETAIDLAMPGRHNVRNALAAASIALGLGIALDTIAAGLNAAEPVAGRLIAHRLRNGAVLIDDSYNANPGSLAAAIDTLAESSRGGEGWLVLGDMRELGADAAYMHAEMGRRAKAAGIRRLYALGPLSAEAAHAFGEGASQYDNHDTLIGALNSELLQGDALQANAQRGVRVLVKGSRGSAMDKIVKAVLGAAGEGNTDAA